MRQRIKRQLTLETAACKGPRAALTITHTSVAVVVAVSSNIFFCAWHRSCGCRCRSCGSHVEFCFCWHRSCCWGVRVRRRSSWQMLGCWMWAELLGAPCLLLPCPLPAPGTQPTRCRGTRSVLISSGFAPLYAKICVLAPTAYVRVLMCSKRWVTLSIPEAGTTLFCITMARSRLCHSLQHYAFAVQVYLHLQLHDDHSPAAIMLPLTLLHFMLCK